MVYLATEYAQYQEMPSYVAAKKVPFQSTQCSEQCASADSRVSADDISLLLLSPLDTLSILREPFSRTGDPLLEADALEV